MDIFRPPSIHPQERALVRIDVPEDGIRAAFSVWLLIEGNLERPATSLALSVLHSPRSDFHRAAVENEARKRLGCEDIRVMNPDVTDALAGFGGAVDIFDDPLASAGHLSNGTLERRPGDASAPDPLVKFTPSSPKMTLEILQGRLSAVLTAAGVPASLCPADAEIMDLLRDKGFTIFERIGEELDLDAAETAHAHVKQEATPASVVFYAERSEFSAWRRQAAASAPAFAAMIAMNHGARAAVDDGQPLVPAIENITGMKKAHLQRLGKLARHPDWEESGTCMLSGSAPLFDGRAEGADAIGVTRTRRVVPPCGWSMRDVAQALAASPPERVPASPGEWEAMTAILGSLAIPVRDAVGIPLEETMQLPKSASGSWLKHFCSLMNAAGMPQIQRPDRMALAMATIDALESVDALARQIVLPTVFAVGQGLTQTNVETISAEKAASLWQDSSRVAMAMMGGSAHGARAGTLLAASRREMSRRTGPAGIWNHLDKPEIYGGSPHDPGHHAQDDRIIARPEWSDGMWEPLVDEKTFRDLASEMGVSVAGVPLVSPAMLKDEGRKMHHCIGGDYYRRKGQSARSHYISIRSPEGSSTLEIADNHDVNAPGGRFRIVQNWAWDNQPPNTTQKAFANALVCGLNNGTVAIRRDATEFAAWVKSQEDVATVGRRDTGNNVPLPNICGYDVGSEDTRAAIWAVWSQEILPGSWRKRRPEALGTVPETRDAALSLLKSVNRTAWERLQQRQQPQRRPEPPGQQPGPAP